jgi:EF hand
MKKQLFAAVFAALMTGVPYAAYAQEAPPPPGPGGGMMMRADANHDGIITRDEMMADVDQRFARMDANHDGKIDQAERDAAREAMMARRGGEGDGAGRGMGRRADPNGDGSITLDEQRAQAGRRFDMADANHDGKIDQAEQDAMRQRMMSRRGPPPADAPSPPNGN